MKRVWLLFSLLTMNLPLWAESDSTATLQDCFQKALQRSESVAIQDESIRIAEAHYLQALGTTLPHLNVKATETLQETSGTPGSDGSVASTFVRRSRPEVAVTVKQPLFQGLREFRALAVSSAEKKKNTLQRNRAGQLLFTDVARAYYTVLELEEEMKILDSIQETLQKRILEIKERVRLGKSRESEILAAESQTSAVEATREKTHGLLDTARDMLSFLTGEETKVKLVDDFKIPSAVESLENYLASVESRPDLEASAESVRLAQGKLSYEKGGRLPTVDLDANYYPYRVGFLSDIRWDLLFTLNLPIFQGGATKGRIREAAASLKQSELAKSEATRRAELEVRQAYHNLQSSISREEALQKAASKAAANYQAEVEDYRLGLINNLEVLQALRDWQERRFDKNRSHFQTKLDYLQLKTATGDLPMEGK